jgi:hypothetical protein
MEKRFMIFGNGNISMHVKVWHVCLTFLSTEKFERRR